MAVKPLLILGIGNDLLSDDGIGIKLIEDLRPMLENPLVEFKTASGGGLEIVELMQDYNDVIILDAIKTGQGVPGEIYTFSLDDFKETLHISNFHDISFLIALEFGKQSGLKLPENIQIVAIEIVEDMYFSEYFSKEIALQYNKIKVKIQEFLQKQLEIKYMNSSTSHTV